MLSFVSHRGFLSCLQAHRSDAAQLGMNGGCAAASLRRRLAAVAELSGLCLLAGLVGGCDPGVEPEATNGQPLRGTGDIRCRGDASLALSPDQRWLVYESRQGDPFAPVFVLLDLTAEEPHATTLTAAVSALAKEGRGPMLPACWSEQSDAVFFPGHGVWFAVALDDDAFELVPVAAANCRSPGATPIPPAVDVDKVSPKRLRLEGRGGRVLAEHGTEHFSSDRLEAAHLRASPDGELLAYVIKEYLGSFARPARGYVLSMRSEALQPPRLLAASVFGPLHWTSGRDLYGCTRRTDDPRSQPRIVRWRF